jgi:site-specific recombinase XerD
MLIQTGRGLGELSDGDFAAFGQAITEREERLGRELKHYHGALYAARAVVYHLGAPAEPAPKRSTLGRWSWERHLDGVTDQVRKPMTGYLERLAGTLARSSVQGAASELAHFGRFLARHDPGLVSMALLDRQRHIEPYLNEVASAVNRRTGAPIAASTAKQRIQTVGSFLDAIAEWGWPEAPARRLIFPRDAPKLPHPLPRYLPPDQERALLAALENSPNRLRADALLLLRATGMRIGELTTLELDCVHEVPGSGAWLKVPLGKLLTERMVPIDDETVEIIDRITEHRSPGRPLRHPRTGKMADFLLTHQGRRVSAETIRDELHRAAAEAGLDGVVPHMLRHTYATALVNAGCSLQALMALLGHVSAAMSLRYGRLFDATVRDEYQRALTLAKAQLGPVLPADRTQLPVTAITGGNWRDAPLIKARLAGGYCLRAAAQGPCAYANICEHCPNFRSDTGFLPVLQLQRADAEALAADAEARGWGEEAARHRRLLGRLDLLIDQANAS